MPTFCTHPAHAHTHAQMHYIPNPFSNLHGRLPHLQFGLNQGLSQSMGFFRVAWSLTADWNHEKQSIGVMSGAGSERQNPRAHQQHHPIASSFFLWYVYMYFFEQAQYLKKPLQQVLFRKFSWKSLAGAVFFQPWFGYCWLYMYSSCKLSTLKGSWRHVALSNKDRLPCHMVLMDTSERNLAVFDQIVEAMDQSNWSINPTTRSYDKNEFEVAHPLFPSISKPTLVRKRGQCWKNPTLMTHISRKALRQMLIVEHRTFSNEEH
jgi:hypothetical protein